MKKIILSLVLALGVLAGCGQVAEQPEETRIVQETPQKGQGTVEVEIVIEAEHDGKTLMEVVKEVAEVQEADGFINGVNDMVADPDKKEFIGIYVNGEMAMVGANDLVVNSGDEVEFKKETWE
jgi:urease gamma subunit